MFAFICLLKFSPWTLFRLDAVYSPLKTCSAKCPTCMMKVPPNVQLPGNFSVWVGAGVQLPCDVQVNVACLCVC